MLIRSQDKEILVNFNVSAGSMDREYLDEFDLEHFEVVGNIFDNKELLQEEYK